MQFELAQETNVVAKEKIATAIKMKDLCRKAIAEGCVLLKNDGILPIGNKKISLFGRCQINTFYVGYGSGGDVKPPYQVSILEGLINCKANLNNDLIEKYLSWTKNNIPDEGTWGNWPLCFKEMELNEEIVKDTSLNSDLAVVIIGRSAGEDRDIKPIEGSWYLNKEEKEMLYNVRKEFDKVCVIINSGSIMDVSEIMEFNPNAILLVWQGGQETGNGVADVLIGNVSPSGKLTDTLAKIEDYPSTNYFGSSEFNEYTEDIYVGYRYFNTFKKDKIIYPFGYGLTYSKFEYSLINISKTNTKFDLKINVKNIGNYTAKEVLQVYLSKPQGQLGNPSVELVSYYKTIELKPLETECIDITFDIANFASYDDLGLVFDKNSFVLEKGEYKLFIGFNSLDLTQVYSFNLEENLLVRRTQEACAPVKSFKRMINKNGIEFSYVPLRSVDIKNRIIKYIPQNNVTNEKYYNFDQVRNGEISLDEFVNSLDFEELEALTRGSLYAMDSPLGPDGNAGTFGASNEKLFKRGIKAISTNDGPSGVRLLATSTQLPNGVLIASTFNDELIEDITYELGKEVSIRNSNVILAPGLNIHRNPLCGRNFEYFSEDPYLSGMIAAAYVRGVQKANVSACPKHFACNNQEFHRHINDSRLSERALREIYLKGFELCIKSSNPSVIMTSYNKINGEFAFYNHDLVRIILREEMNYSGLVITDWWMQDDESKIFEDLKKQAYRIRATVDVYMPGSGGTRDNPGVSDNTLAYSYEKKAISLAEIRYCAKNVLNLCLKYGW